MKKFLKFIIPVGVFILVMSAGGLVAKAARPDKPVFPTLQEVQQMISDAVNPLQTAMTGLGNRLSLVETAVTANTSDIQELQTVLNQQKPPFDVVPNYWAADKINHNGSFGTIQVGVTAGTNLGGSLSAAQYWGYAHTPDGVVASRVQHVSLTENYLFFDLPQYYPISTPIEIEIYAFYGGKIGKTTINL